MCCKTFKKEKESLAHMKEFDTHVVVKKSLKGRISDMIGSVLLSYPWDKLPKFVGLYILYQVAKNHWAFDVTCLEACLIGLAIGLIA